MAERLLTASLRYPRLAGLLWNLRPPFLQPLFKVVGACKVVGAYKVVKAYKAVEACKVVGKPVRANKPFKAGKLGAPVGGFPGLLNGFIFNDGEVGLAIRGKGESGQLSRRSLRVGVETCEPRGGWLHMDCAGSLGVVREFRRYFGMGDTWGQPQVVRLGEREV
ncbi:hypothetical protein B0T21DRAFT_352355 [Apiosordaria backusii]|uniref:Uncharacterized protein n=1 Tax=Apiosordaria backusii TaxID=314023 RepID=A0AA40DT09_9PEZI|nr:hypothetical protein B0T21DRAFT_352355 [Apiosordaria backusii]